MRRPKPVSSNDTAKPAAAKSDPPIAKSEKPSTFEQARGWVRTWFDGAPKKPWLRNAKDAFARVEQLRNDGDTDAALVAASAGFERFPDDVSLANARAELFFLAGRQQEAFQAFMSVVHRWPTHCGALSNLGVLLWTSGNVGESLDVLWWALEVDPYRRDTCMNCGNVLMALGKLELAQSVFEAAAAGGADDEELREALASVRQRRSERGDDRDLVSIWDDDKLGAEEATKKSDPRIVWREQVRRQHAAQRCELAIGFMVQRDFMSALLRLQEVGPQGLDGFAWHGCRAACLYALERYEEALDEASAQVRIDSGEAGAKRLLELIAVRLVNVRKSQATL